MKRIALSLIFFGVVFAAAFQWGRSEKSSFFSAECTPAYLDYGFRPTDYPLEQRPFVIVVIGRNNGAFVEKTLRSIFFQQYQNYRLVYVDDGSDDGSYSLVKDVIEGCGLKEISTLVRNEEPIGQLANLYAVLKEAADHEIVVWVDGHDWLAHEWALSRLNSYYADSDLWLTFGQYREFPDYRLGSSSPFSYALWKEKGVRQIPFAASHLKTFYAGLFKHIDPADFAYQGTFLSVGADLAVMVPLFELADGHFQFIPEVLYIASPHASTPESQDLLMKTQRYVRSLASYDPIPYFMKTDVAYE